MFGRERDVKKERENGGEDEMKILKEKCFEFYDNLERERERDRGWSRVWRGGKIKIFGNDDYLQAHQMYMNH